MRNLKRALSMAMASVMLMGMSVVGTSAVSVNDFSDVDSINNKEAVAIATGLGIFDGYDDGEFKPERVVTRAEMAVVIAKILHGADVDPSIFVGDSKFTDVPAWAEGYVNLCDSLGIIEGYGDGKFGPNDPVTTVQANIMLLKALGYYTAEGDSLPNNWADAQLQATSKATALGFFGDKALKMDAGLTREDVAELTFNALFAQRVAYDDVRGLHVKANDRMVVVTNGTKDEYNTLAHNTFDLYAVEGTVIANGMTSEKLSASLKSEAQTRVLFDENVDLDKDGKVDATADKYYDFEIASGLDFIGHAVTVYYTIENKAPVVYAMVDEATLVAELTYNGNTTKLADAANEAGFKKNTILDWAGDYFVNYDLTTKVSDLASTPAAVNLTTPANKTLVLISNSGNKNVDCVFVLDQYLDTVANVDEGKDSVKYTLKTNTTADLVIAGEALAEDDYVIVTDIGKQGDVLVTSTPQLVSAEVTKLTGKSSATSYVTGITADGEQYKKSNVYSNAQSDSELSGNLPLVTAFRDVTKIGETVLILDENGNCIGLADEKTLPNYAYVAQYGYETRTVKMKPENVLTALIYFADGTSATYDVETDLTKSTGLNKITAVAALDNGDADTKIDADNIVTAVNELNEVSYSATAAHDATKGGIGVYDVTLTNGKAVIKLITTDETDKMNDATYKVVKKHSTLVNAGNANMVAANGAAADKTIYQNADTVYFYVSGNYNDESLSVVPVVGVKNAINFTNGAVGVDGTTNTGIVQGFVNETGARYTAKAMQVLNVAAASADVFYYNQGNFHVHKNDDGKYVITYDLYGADGSAYTVTYDKDSNGKDFATAAAAEDHADNYNNGYYTVGVRNLQSIVPANTFWPAATHTQNKGDVTYVVNTQPSYDQYVDNIFDLNVLYGAISDNAVVIDATGHGIDSQAEIVNILKAMAKDVAKYGTTEGVLTLSYSFDKDTYEADLIYVSAYAPVGTQAPGGDVNYNGEVDQVILKKDGHLTLVLKGVVENDTTYSYKLYTRAAGNNDFALADEDIITVGAGRSAKTIDLTADNTMDGTSAYIVIDGVNSKTVMLKNGAVMSAAEQAEMLKQVVEAPAKTQAEADNRISATDTLKPSVALVSTGLTQELDGTTIKLSGKVTDLKAKDTDGTLSAKEKAGLKAYYGQETMTGLDDLDGDKIGFVLVTVNGKSHFITVEQYTDGSGAKQVRLAHKQNGANTAILEKTNKGITYQIDVSGLSF